MNYIEDISGYLGIDFEFFNKLYFFGQIYKLYWNYLLKNLIEILNLLIGHFANKEIAQLYEHSNIK